MAVTATRVQELQAVLQTKTDEMEAISKSFKIEEKSDEDGGGTKGVVVTTEQKNAYRALLDESKELRELIDLEQGLEGQKNYLDQPDRASVAALIAAIQEKGLGREAAAPSLPGIKSMGQAFVESDEFKALVTSGGTHMPSPWEYEGKDFVKGLYRDAEFKDVYTTLPGTMTTLGFGTMEIDPIVPRAHRTFRVRDLFPARPTTANLIDFFRVTGFTNGASVVPERVSSAFGLKPQSSLTFAVTAAPVRTIATYEAAHRNVLADAPQLQSIIESELLYGLQLHEDYQILQGSGTGEDLLGILNTSGIQTYAPGGSPATITAEQDADSIRRAATLAFLAFYEPTGVVLHPYDWEQIELVKDSQNRYIVSGSVSMGAEQRLWRMPVVQTPAIPQNTALVGAFGIAAQLYDRQQSNIRISEEHSDFFLRNAIAILAEERLALAVKRPEAFVKVTGL